jgi:hypothetical protein
MVKGESLSEDNAIQGTIGCVIKKRKKVFIIPQPRVPRYRVVVMTVMMLDETRQIGYSKHRKSKPEVEKSKPKQTCTHDNTFY